MSTNHYNSNHFRSIQGTIQIKALALSQESWLKKPCSQSEGFSSESFSSPISFYSISSLMWNLATMLSNGKMKEDKLSWNNWGRLMNQTGTQINNRHPYNLLRISSTTQTSSCLSKIKPFIVNSRYWNFPKYKKMISVFNLKMLRQLCQKLMIINSFKQFKMTIIHIQKIIN